MIHCTKNSDITSLTEDFDLGLLCFFGHQQVANLYRGTLI